MYESYWRLQQKAFENCADPHFYYPSESHQAALLKLRYAIENRRGAALLAGPSGSGKTLLVTMLRATLGQSFIPFVHLVFPQMDTEQLLSYLADELTEHAAAVQSIPQSIRRIEQFLTANTERGRHAVVAVDEAHLLDGRTLETLRLLLNFELAGRSALTLLLVGQPAILPMLDRAPQLAERLGVKSLLRPFSEAETSEYVDHRLRMAGGAREVFGSQAKAALYRLTHGIPRRVNRICDLAMLIGYAEQQTSVSAEQLESVSQELVTVAPE